MAEAHQVATSRRECLRVLESQIRQDYEAFVATGFDLKEIRDDGLCREGGFESWEQYLKERVGKAFGVEKTQANTLITCAQVRVKLDERHAGHDGGSWSQRELLELARLAPRDKSKPGHTHDFDALDRRLV
jgi:hypothetical protein